MSVIRDHAMLLLNVDENVDCRIKFWSCNVRILDASMRTGSGRMIR